jgi:hypothetical protein
VPENWVHLSVRVFLPRRASGTGFVSCDFQRNRWLPRGFGPKGASARRRAPGAASTRRGDAGP